MQGVKIENLTVSYGDKKIFDGFSREFEKDKICVILGESGVGKSTLLNVIASLVPFEGSVEKCGSEISYIFQKDRLIPTISVYKNLDLILRSVFKDKNERRKRIEDMLDMLEIRDIEHKLPTEISGGQAGRVSMARAYLFPSEILLADEPFKALDTALKSRLILQLASLNESCARTVLFVTHDIAECLLLADEYVVLGKNPAEIVLEGRIDVPQKERKLDSTVLAKEREKLLAKLCE